MEKLVIRHPTPILHVVSLSHGNFGTTGNTSLVWQRLKSNVVVPSLPDIYKYICVTFWAIAIWNIIELIPITLDGVWKKVTILQDNINVWPEEEGILEMAGTPIIATTINKKAESTLTVHGDISDNLLDDGNN